MDNRNKLKLQNTIDILLLELDEVNKQINQLSGLSVEIIPEFSKKFLMEDLKQYENYLRMKLAKETGSLYLNNN